MDHLGDQATELGKASALALQAVSLACELDRDPALTSMVACVDAMAAMSGEWGDFVFYELPILSAFVGFPLNEPASATPDEVLEWMNESAAKYEALPVPRGTDRMATLIDEFYATVTPALESAAGGEMGALRSADVRAREILDDLDGERLAMYKPCAFIYAE